MTIYAEVIIKNCMYGVVCYWSYSVLIRVVAICIPNENYLIFYEL